VSFKVLARYMCFQIDGILFLVPGLTSIARGAI